MKKKRVLFVITSDPGRSGRAAEAIRIAAGVGSWMRVEVAVYFGAAARAALGEWAEELVDGENYARYLPLLLEAGGQLYSAVGEPCGAEAGDRPVRCEQLSNDRLAALAAESDQVLHF